MPVSGDSTKYADQEESGDGNKPGSSASPAKKRKPLVNKKDWERFYDDTAKAYYWFNASTGEARWTDPTK